jgi:hypothetical protein
MSDEIFRRKTEELTAGVRKMTHDGTIHDLVEKCAMKNREVRFSYQQFGHLLKDIDPTSWKTEKLTREQSTFVECYMDAVNMTRRAIAAQDRVRRYIQSFVFQDCYKAGKVCARAVVLWLKFFAGIFSDKNVFDLIKRPIYSSVHGIDLMIPRMIWVLTDLAKYCMTRGRLQFIDIMALDNVCSLDFANLRCSSLGSVLENDLPQSHISEFGIELIKILDTCHVENDQSFEQHDRVDDQFQKGHTCRSTLEMELNNNFDTCLDENEKSLDMLEQRDKLEYQFREGHISALEMDMINIFDTCLDGNQESLKMIEPHDELEMLEDQVRKGDRFEFEMDVIRDKFRCLDEKEKLERLVQHDKIGLYILNALVWPPRQSALPVCGLYGHLMAGMADKSGYFAKLCVQICSGNPGDEICIGPNTTVQLREIRNGFVDIDFTNKDGRNIAVPEFNDLMECFVRECENIKNKRYNGDLIGFKYPVEDLAGLIFAIILPKAPVSGPHWDSLIFNNAAFAFGDFNRYIKITAAVDMPNNGSYFPEETVFKCLKKIMEEIMKTQKKTEGPEERENRMIVVSFGAGDAPGHVATCYSERIPMLSPLNLNLGQTIVLGELNWIMNADFDCPYWGFRKVPKDPKVKDERGPFLALMRICTRGRRGGDPKTAFIPFKGMKSIIFRF